MTSTRFARPRAPLSLFTPLAAAALLSACGGGGGGDSSRADIVASIPEGCRFLADPAFELSNAELIDIRNAGCLLPSPNDSGTVSDGPVRSNVAAAPPLDTVIVEAGPELADIEGSTFYSDANNSALLRGSVIGAGTMSNAGLSRAIPFHVEERSDALALLHVSVVANESDSGELIGIVENRSDTLHCQVSIEGTTVYDASGTQVEREFDWLTFAFVDGAVAFGSTLGDDACIPPNSRAYVSMFAAVPSDEIRSFAATHLDSDQNLTRLSVLQVEPVSYDVEGGWLSVTVANRSLSDVDVSSLQVYLLDENGHTIGSESLYSGIEPLAPGQEGVVSGPLGPLAGQSSSIRVLVDFDPVEE